MSKLFEKISGSARILAARALAAEARLLLRAEPIESS
jgi:ABC-type Mn2+/Zn2+ transport system ATPase subunit